MRMPTDPMWCFENYGEAAEYIDQIEKQRDELLAALKEVRDLGHNYTQVSHRVWIIADDAITKAGGCS